MRWKQAIVYDDFVVQLVPGQGGEHRAVVVASAEGGGSAPFRSPFSPGELDTFLIVQAAGRGARLLDAAPRLTPEEVGSRLFQALIAGEVRDRWIASLAQAERAGSGLRLQLRLSPRAPGFGALHRLPWELLHDPERRVFLALSRRTPVVRHLELAGALLPPPPLPAPLRLLALYSAPADQDSLLLDQELGGLRRPWRRGVEVVQLDADREAMRETLLDPDRPIHVLHFMGHGAFEETAGRGLLYFADAAGRTLPVAARDLAAELDATQLRLVFLNACDTALIGARPGDDPFAGTAAALLLGGVPALVAMQASVPDEDAVAFSVALYRRLAAGDPLEAAVAEGRLAVSRRAPGSAQWAIPVLYLRGPDGRLFDTALPAGEAPPWTWPDLAAHGAGVMAATGLAGLLPVHLATSLPTAAGGGGAVALGTAALTAWSLERARAAGLLPALGRRGRLACAAALVATSAAWATHGASRLCDLRCAPLGCSDTPRAVVAELRDRSPAPSAQSAAWAGETRGVLADQLRAAGLQVLGGPLDPAQRCVDYRIAGSLIDRGEQVTLTAEAVDERGTLRSRVSATALPDPAGTLLHAQGLLVRALLQDLGVPLTRAQERAVLQTPTRDPAALRLNNLGVAELEGGDAEQAAARFEAALALDPIYSSAWNNLGMVKLRQGHPRAAARCFEQAIRSFSDNPTYHFNLGLAHQDLGHPAAAVAAYQAALARDPSDARIHNNLGNALLQAGRPDTARRSLRRALGFALDPDLRAVVYKNLGLVALAEGDAEEAAARLTAALRLAPDFAEALVELARAEERRGDRAAACAALARYGRLPAPDEPARQRAAGVLAARLGCPPGGGR